MKSTLSALILLALALCASAPARAAEGKDAPLLFNVLNQRTVSLTAQYWNPILRYVSEKSGVPLELRLTRTAKENNARSVNGEFAFLFTNQFFTPERDVLGYRVIARPIGAPIKGQIIVAADSPLKSLSELEGKKVGFPSRDAFAAYWVPMDAIIKARVNVETVLTGNQEAAGAQLKLGTLDAAGVNNQVIQRWARREAFEYRVLWDSEAFNDLCIMANPDLPRSKVEAVRDAFIRMKDDAEGRKVLKAAADVLKIKGDTGFVPGDNTDYDNYRAFYKNTRVSGNAANAVIKLN
jgi:phosphonate transport system substrate-binding protein